MGNKTVFQKHKFVEECLNLESVYQKRAYLWGTQFFKEQASFLMTLFFKNKHFLHRILSNSDYFG